MPGYIPDSRLRPDCMTTAPVCGAAVVMAFPSSVSRLIATCKRRIALLKPGIAKGALQKPKIKRRGTEGISTVFFCLQRNRFKKNIEIPRSRLL